MIRKKLILITNEFPFGNGETYLEPELPYLSTLFEKIIIIPINPTNQYSRQTPNNVIIVPFNTAFKKAYSLNLFYRSFVEYSKEVLFCFRSYRILPRRSSFFQLVDYLKKGTELCTFISTKLNEYKWDHNETVLYSYWSAHSAVAVAAVKKKYSDLYAISRAHGWDLYFERTITNYIPLRRFVLKNIDKVHPVSSQGAYYLDRKLGYKFGSTIEPRYLGVNILSKKSTNLNDSKVIHLVSCARLVKLKRIHLIIESLKDLASRKLPVNIHWTHIGDGPLLNELKNKSNKLFENQNKVTFEFKGDLINKDVLDFYKLNVIDLFINVSEWEGLPVSIMEAASYSIPIIATNVGGVSEILRNGRNGWLLPKQVSGEVIANKIEDWLKLTPNEKKRFRLQSYNISQKRFNAKHNFYDWAEELITS